MGKHRPERIAVIVRFEPDEAALVKRAVACTQIKQHEFIRAAIIRSAHKTLEDAQE